MLSNIWFAAVITLVLALAWLRINDYFAHRGWISGRLSRKIIHMGTGPIFVLCWLLFPNHPAARYLAAFVPLAFSIQFLLIGLGVIKDQPSVDAMSRHGDPREILRGPLLYGVVFVVLTILYWKDHPAGIMALMLLCGGDGLADIVGRLNRGPRLPWSPQKSVIGSLGMFFGGWLFAVIVLAIFYQQGIFVGTITGALSKITAIAIIGTVIESLPFHDIDNITVTTTAVILGHLFNL